MKKQNLKDMNIKSLQMRTRSLLFIINYIY